jgi:4-nitrophenyl phosphatase
MSNMLPHSIKSLILDMDGVLWKGNTPIGQLPIIFDRIQARGLKVAFATNNGSQTPDQYVERLASLGVHAEPWQVITSSMGLVSLLKERFPLGSQIFAIGGIGVVTALRESGFNILPIEGASKAQALVMGIDVQINFEKMSEAALLVRRGVPFFATNPDKTFPTPRGEIPGAGAWISVITTATGVEPIFAGKPFPRLIEIARERLGTSQEETLVVGDRLETDISAAQAAGCPCALVCSGVSTYEQGMKWKPDIDIISVDLWDLIK